MKKIMKLAAMLLSVMAIAASTSCAKDDNTGTSNNGSSGGSNEVIDVKYTMGYYHPAKKIKKINPHDELFGDEYVFLWDGDNLKSITIKNQPYPDVVFECHYSNNGYITSWTEHEEGYDDDIRTFDYKKNSIVEVTPLGDNVMYTFDNNGVLTKIGNKLVTMLNGNAVKIGTQNYIYDEQPNPFLNLLFPSIQLYFTWPMEDMNDGCSVASKNNGLYSNYVATGDNDDYYWDIEYDADGWPIRWYSVTNNGTSSSGVHTIYTIEYYN